MHREGVFTLIRGRFLVDSFNEMEDLPQTILFSLLFFDFRSKVY